MSIRCPHCRRDLSSHYDGAYRREKADRLRKVYAVVWLAVILWCVGFTLLFSVAGCGDGSSSAQSRDALIAAKAKPIELRWDHSYRGPVDGWRVHILRRNGKIKTYLVDRPCWRGPSDAQAELAWVTAIRDGMESDPSDEILLPCR
jgi:hypothetical protein